MEKFENPSEPKESSKPKYQKNRDNLADDLKEIRNSDPENPEIAHAEARGYLEATRERDPYYHKAKLEHNWEIFKKTEGPRLVAEIEEAVIKKAEEANSVLEELKQDPVIGKFFLADKFVAINIGQKVDDYFHETRNGKGYQSSGDCTGFKRPWVVLDAHKIPLAQDELSKTWAAINNLPQVKQAKENIDIILANQDKIPTEKFLDIFKRLKSHLHRTLHDESWRSSLCWELYRFAYPSMDSEGSFYVRIGFNEKTGKWEKWSL